MSFKNENWEKSDFQMKNLRSNTNILPTNRNVTDAVTTDFLTYNSNNHLPCYPYQMASRECVNKYGIGREIMSNRACMVS